MFKNLGNKITMELIPEMSEIVNKTNKMSVLCEIKIPEKCDYQLERIPLELAIVLDVSGSMNVCLNKAISAINDVLDSLKEQDIIHIVTYSDNANIVVENGLLL